MKNNFMLERFEDFLKSIGFSNGYDLSLMGLLETLLYNNNIEVSSSEFYMDSKKELLLLHMLSKAKNEGAEHVHRFDLDTLREVCCITKGSDITVEDLIKEVGKTTVQLRLDDKMVTVGLIRKPRFNKKNNYVEIRFDKYLYSYLLLLRNIIADLTDFDIKLLAKLLYHSRINNLECATVSFSIAELEDLLTYAYWHQSIELKVKTSHLFQHAVTVETNKSYSGTSMIQNIVFRPDSQGKQVDIGYNFPNDFEQGYYKKIRDSISGEVNYRLFCFLNFYRYLGKCRIGIKQLKRRLGDCLDENVLKEAHTEITCAGFDYQYTTIYEGNELSAVEFSILNTTENDKSILFY